MSNQMKSSSKEDLWAEATRSGSISGQQRELLTTLGISANGAVHEIANPLNTIVMNTELALLYLEQSPEELKRQLPGILQAIIKEARQAGNITHKAAQFMSRPGCACRVDADLGEIVSRARDQVGARLGTQFIELDIAVAIPAPKISVSPLALENAIAALLEIFIESGAERVLLSLNEESGEMVLVIRNGDEFRPIESWSTYSKQALTLVKRILSAQECKFKLDDSSAFEVRFPVVI